jgi:BRCT domain type II-containing protein
MEDSEEEEDEDNDNLMNDILTSDEEEETIKTTRKTKLVPIDAIDDADQETLRSLSFNERAKRINDSSTISSSRSHNQNQITTNTIDNRRKINDNHRKNIRRAPRGRMNSRRSEP